MTATSGLDELLAAAQAEVRTVDWTTWQVPAGDSRIAEYQFADQPALTQGLFAGYLSTCAWIWQRPIRADEVPRVQAALNSLWLDRGLAMDYGPLLDVLSLVALPEKLRALPPDALEPVRQQLLDAIPDGRFPGVDVAVPGGEAAAALERSKIPPSTLRGPDETGFALDGLYSGSSFGLQLDIFGAPGSGTWESKTEFYAFFLDGTYLYFPSAAEAGAHLRDPRGHKAYEGEYEVAGGSIRLYDASNGETNTSDFIASQDRRQIGFYGKTYEWVSETTGLRVADPATPGHGAPADAAPGG